jgi:outer membrane protein assembly factor BamB
MAALAGLGCGSLRRRANADLPVWKNRAGGVISLSYSRDLVANSRKKGEPYERGEPEIDVAGRRVFVGSSDGGLYALSAPLGEVIWRFETLSYVQSAPLYDEGEDVLYFGSHDGALYKVEAKTGELLWRMSTRAEVARRPVLRDGLVYFANANDTLIAADAQTGKIAWTYHRTPAAGMEVAGYSGPALSETLVYMGFSDGTATAFDLKTGQERWVPVDLAAEAEEQLGELPKYLDVDTTPEVVDADAGRIVVFGSYAGGVYALDADMGTTVWTQPRAIGVSDVSYYFQPAYERAGIQRAARRLLLVTTGTTGLWALDPETGAEVWRREVPRGGISGSAFIDGALVVNASQLGTFLVSPVDGSVIDGFHFDFGASGSPAAYGQRAFVMTNGGTLLALTMTPPGRGGDGPNYHESGPSPFGW